MSSTVRQRGKILWLIGHSGAGKTTLCEAVAENLRQRGEPIQILDGDILRGGLCSDLGFSPEDRMENARRVAHVADMFAEQGITILVGLICPLESIRRLVQSIIPDHMQIFVDAPISVCENRDSKGLYRRAREGALPGFTGVDSNFEPPPAPDLVCRTYCESITESAAKILALLQKPSDCCIRAVPLCQHMIVPD